MNARRIAVGFKSAAENLVYIKRRGWVRKAILALPDWMTANRVTSARFVLVIPLVLAALTGAYWQALAWFVLAALLDALDGMIAEARDMKTTLGAFLDPLADKAVTLATIGVFLTRLPAAFAWIFIPIALFGLGNTVGRIIKMALATPARPTNILAVTASKVKFHLESYGCVLLLLSFALGAPALLWPSGILLAASIPFATLSFKAQLPTFRCQR